MSDNNLRNLGYSKLMLVNQSTNKDFRLDFFSYHEWFDYEGTLKKLYEIKKRIGHMEYGMMCMQLFKLNIYYQSIT